MNKTLLVKGLTTIPAAAGTANDAVLDITEKVYGVKPSLASPTTTSRYFSTAFVEVVEGKAKFEIARKRHITLNDSTAKLHTGSAVGGDSVGTVTTAGFKAVKADSYDFTLDRSWEIGLILDKKKDEKVLEGQVFTGVATEMEDMQEQKDHLFWTTIESDIDKAGTKSSKKYKAYSSSAGNKQVASHEIYKEIDASAAEHAKKAAAIVDGMFMMVEEQAKIGRIGSPTAEFPYARGTRGVLNSKFVIKAELVPVISHDERFIQTGLSQEQIQRGVIGIVNNTEVERDDVFDTSCTLDIALVPTGAYGVCAVVQELADDILSFDHPTKPTRARLIEGSGAWDLYLTPYQLLGKYAEVKLA